MEKVVCGPDYYKFMTKCCRQIWPAWCARNGQWLQRSKQWTDQRLRVRYLCRDVMKSVVKEVYCVLPCYGKSWWVWVADDLSRMQLWGQIRYRYHRDQNPRERLAANIIGDMNVKAFNCWWMWASRCMSKYCPCCRPHIIKWNSYHVRQGRHKFYIFISIDGVIMRRILNESTS